MRKSKPNSIEESLKEFEQISTNFNWVDSDFNAVYSLTIKPIAESMYMFNYFHWITNFKEMRIIHTSGIQKMLGYEDNDFTLEQSFAIIHPNFRPFIHAYAKNAYEMLKEPKYRPLSSKAHYSIQFPLLHKDGYYILVQMNVSIIVTDTNGNPLVNYNRFEVLGKYANTPINLKPRVLFRTGIDLSERAQQAEKELIEKVRDFILKVVAFTPTELEIVKELANEKSRTEISEALDIPSILTIDKHNAGILKKGRKCFSPLFDNARSIALYLRSMDVI